MNINPDKIIIFKISFININFTILVTWIVILLLTVLTFIATRKLSSGPDISRRQQILESIVVIINNQLKNITGLDYALYYPYLGTLFVFIFTANMFSFIPLFHAPTSSFSTTAALAFTVFIAVPVFGIMKNGFISHLKYYFEPVFIMLPLNIITEITRTAALAIRLFGNLMSESLVGAILLMIVPLFVPVIMDLLGLVICAVQSYIFFILAAVFIGGAAAARE
jgi:F-type H+-transporting ATPase subunit a